MPATRAVARSVLVLLAACGSSSPRAGHAPAPPPRDDAARRHAPAERARPERLLVWAWLSDARGLAVGARVTVAGLPVGEIAAIGSGPHGTRVDIALPHDLAVWSNARLSRRPTHVAGELRLELDPGEEPTGSQGAGRFAPRRLADGDEIADVVEDITAQDLMERVDRTLPHR